MKNAAAGSAFALCGQSCTLGSRLLVQRSIYAEVVKEMAVRADAIRIGRPSEAASQIGPQAHARQLEKTLSYIDIGKAEGAQLVAGGDRPGGDLTGGYFIRPTVFADVAPDMRIAQEEIFGPVVGIIPFEEEEDAVHIANSTQYGLTAGIWTNDLGRAHRMVRNLRAGTVWINTFRFVRWNLPYGGVGVSGLGRENGPNALDAYLEWKTAVINLGGTFADPYAA